MSLRRMNLFGVTQETLYQEYLQNYGMLDKQQFLTSLQQLDKEPALVACTSLYIHLLDQFQWELLSGDELTQAGNDLLLLTAGKYHLSSSTTTTADQVPGIQAWSVLVVKILADRNSNSQE